MELVINRRGIDVDLSYEHKQQCPRCVSEGRDRTGNNLHVYGLDAQGKHKGAKCFACEYTIPSEEWLEDNGHIQEEEISWTMSDFTDDDHERLKAQTDFDSKNWRGITKETSKYFGVRYKYDSEGQLTAQYTPNTVNGTFSGYKKRLLPKAFSAMGTNGAECDLFGQFRFMKSKAKYCMIVGGEIDQLSAYQMLRDYQLQTGKSDYDPVPVVSPTVGESGSFKQIQGQYEWFSRFEKIILCFDNDAAGKAATEKMVLALPKGKVYIAEMTLKDPNEYLKQGKQRDFVSVFYDAKPFTPAGVHASTELYKAALTHLDTPLLSLPPFMSKAAAMFGGGLVCEEITVILAKTSIGKTTLMSGLTEWWVQNEPSHTIGVLSLEATAPKYTRNLLSYHLQVPLHRMTPVERSEFLSRSDIEKKVNMLFKKTDGSPSFYVCDDRGASIDSVKDKVVEMVIKNGVDVLIIDPYSDLLSGLSVQQQEDIATWLKKLMKEYGVTPIVVSHVRKSANNKEDAPITEDDAQGSSFLVKAAGQTFSLERDKQSLDPMERNRTHITILKNRDFSETGPAGSMYYDIPTACLYDYDDWISNGRADVGF